MEGVITKNKFRCNQKTLNFIKLLKDIVTELIPSLTEYGYLNHQNRTIP